tara:strand:- start:1991 stop:3049 length:1059 start_codon:yes stop_codon:yes gene_type:complete
MNRKIIILIPTLDNSGPARGALAIAEVISKKYKTIIVTQKNSKNSVSSIHSDNFKVKNFNSGYREFRKIRKYLKKELSEKDALISICLSSDLINTMIKGNWIRISYIRGDLISNYRTDYGLIGIPLAIMHYFMTSFLSKVFSLSEKMKKDIEKYSLSRALVIENIIEEKKLEPYRSYYIKKSKTLDFIFLGNLNNRKKPLEAIEAFYQYHMNHKSSVLHIVGDGPLKVECENLIQNLNMSEYIYMHGHLTDPYKILSSSEILIHTSLAEGVSRSVMESLFLGLIVVGRDIDEHKKLLVDNNSVKFLDTKNIVSALNKASEIVRNSNGSLKKNLLPSLYCNEEVSKKILKSIF